MRANDVFYADSFENYRKSIINNMVVKNVDAHFRRQPNGKQAEKADYMQSVHT